MNARHISELAVFIGYDHALAAGFPGAHEVGEPMKREIAENCGRTLRRLA